MAKKKGKVTAPARKAPTVKVPAKAALVARIEGASPSATECWIWQTQ